MNNPPLPHEVEISLFGPSYGESIAIHATEGRWIIVDSCFSPGSKKSHPLEYLSQIGVNLVSSVKVILATHWDDDHIGGLSECVEKCTSAKFSLSVAISSSEFVSLVRFVKSNFLGKERNVEEFSKILDLLHTRAERPIMAVENLEIWSDSKSSNPSLRPRFLALSPSSTTVMNGHVNIAKLFKKIKATRGRAVHQNRNDRSVVTRLEVGHVSVLLGADLEENGDLNTGWGAILNLGLTKNKDQVFKIAHHGSDDADHPSVWTDLLTTNPIGVLTPWQNGGRTLPTCDDMTRLVARTKNLYVTAIPHSQHVERPKVVQSILDASGIKLRKTNQISGHIRLRADARQVTPAWNVELFGTAKKIEGKMHKAFPKN